MKNSAVRSSVYLHLALFLGLVGTTSLFIKYLGASKATPTELWTITLGGGLLTWSVGQRWLLSWSRSLAVATSLALLGNFLLPSLLIPVAQAATFEVDTLSDDATKTACTTAPDDCSLRGAIRKANNPLIAPGPDTITISLGGTYTLSIANTAGNENEAKEGDLDIRESLTIEVTATTPVIIDANGIDRVFDISPNTENMTVNISNLTITGGSVSDGSKGGGVQVHHTGTTVNFTNVVFDGNQVDQSSGWGGGLGINSGTVTITNSTFKNNKSLTTHGGAITTDGILTLENVTISGNQANKSGGGIRNRGTLTINNSTLSGNISGRDGGAIENANGTTSLNNVTILDNDTDNSGSIYNNGTNFYLKNSIIAKSTTASSPTYDCRGANAFTSQGYNIIGFVDTTQCTFTSLTSDQFGTSSGTTIDPLLGPLQDNGGDTQTHLPLTGSPAIDNGNPATPGSGGDACLGTDQRTIERPDGDSASGGTCDIGAVELSAPQLEIDKETSTPSIAAGGEATYTIVVTNTGDIDATGVIVADTLPDGFTFKQASAPTGTGITRTANQDPTPGTATPSWGVWTIGPRGVLQITFVATAPSPTAETTYHNQVQVSSNETSPVSDDGTETDEDVTVAAGGGTASLTINKTTSTPSIAAGGEATYTIVINNNGTETATGVVVTDNLPTGFTFKQASTPTGTGITRTSTQDPTAGTTTPSWGTWTIDPSGQLQITFTATAPSPTDTQTYRNIAKVSSNETGEIFDNGIDGNQDVTVTGTGPPVGGGEQVFLPLILKPGPGPDLVVEKISVARGTVEVVIKNQGSVDIFNEFWVDLYVDPNPPPNKPNDVWNDGRSQYGAVWGVTTIGLPSLTANGGTLTLTINDAYFNSELSVLPSSFPAGTVIYAQVDSANLNNVFGGVVFETDEGNNISKIELLTVDTLSPPEPQIQAASFEGLPPR